MSEVDVSTSSYKGVDVTVDPENAGWTASRSEPAIRTALFFSLEYLTISKVIYIDILLLYC